jgi:hypothetical protein
MLRHSRVGDKIDNLRMYVVARHGKIDMYTGPLDLDDLLPEAEL